MNMGRPAKSVVVILDGKGDVLHSSVVRVDAAPEGSWRVLQRFGDVPGPLPAGDDWELAAGRGPLPRDWLKLADPFRPAENIADDDEPPPPTLEQRVAELERVMKSLVSFVGSATEPTIGADIKSPPAPVP